MSNEIIDTKFEKIISNSNGKITFTTIFALVIVLLYALLLTIINAIFTPFGVLTLVIASIIWKYIL